MLSTKKPFFWTLTVLLVIVSMFVIACKQDAGEQTVKAKSAATQSPSADKIEGWTTDPDGNLPNPGDERSDCYQQDYDPVTRKPKGRILYLDVTASGATPANTTLFLFNQHDPVNPYIEIPAAPPKPNGSKVTFKFSDSSENNAQKTNHTFHLGPGPYDAFATVSPAVANNQLGGQPFVLRFRYKTFISNQNECDHQAKSVQFK